MPQRGGVDSPYAVWRLLVALALMTIGTAMMYAYAVVLPVVQAEFGVSRAAASMPYTWLMIGFGVGGIWMGRLADRHGVMVPSLISAVGVGSGLIVSGFSGGIWSFTLAHAVLMGLFGTAASFAPLVADTALWFQRRRGVAVAICACGMYLSGTICPPIVQGLFDAYGWRNAYVGMGVFSLVTMTALALLLRRRPPVQVPPVAAATGVRVVTAGEVRPFGLSPGLALSLLCLAGLACCVAMAMPQVHIVAYCTDLGYGAARGAEMLSLMLAFGIVSRIGFGIICDRIGGMRTLLLGSMLQGVALLMFLPFDGLVPLYVISAMFGLFQGGIVPAYAIVVREHFGPEKSGVRVGAVLMFTMLGMALGGWMSGKVFDLTGSYDAAFVNGIVWNLLNLTIAVFLLRRAFRHQPLALPVLGARAA